MSEVSTIVLPVIAAVFAGIGYNLLGIFKQYRSGKGLTPDWGLIGKNTAIGVALGISTFVYSIMYNDAQPLINTGQEFFAAVGGYFPLVVIVDELLIKHKSEEDEE